MDDANLSHPLRLLIVDDEAVVREVLRLRLQLDGPYQCDEACSGREAMEMMRKRSYDLVITDIMMPDEDGITTIEHVHKEYPETHIFAVSAARHDIFLRTARRLGAERTFAKPFPLDELAAAVHETLIARPG